MTPLLSCSRFVLRALEPADASTVFGFENDADLWPYSMPTGPYSHEQIRQYIAGSKNDLYTERQLRLMIDREGDVLGIIDLFDFEPLHARAEMGIAIRPRYRRQGIGREAVTLLAAHCMDRLGLHQLYAYVGANNKPARQLFLSAGFEIQATLPDWIRCGQGFEDVTLLTLRH